MTEKLSTAQLRELFSFVSRVTNNMTSGDNALPLPTANLREVFSTTHKDTIMILLSVSQHLTFCLLRESSVSSDWFPLVFEICKLMYRSPQESHKNSSCSLLDHALNNSHSLESEEDFVSFTRLLNLRAQTLKSRDVTDNDVTSYLERLRTVAEGLVDVKRRIQILEFGTLLFDKKCLSDDFVQSLASLYRNEGHLSDAISLLCEVEYSSPATQLLLSLCHIGMLNCQPAADLLKRIDTPDEFMSASISLLLMYCNFIIAVKKREDIHKPDPVQFCKDAHTVLISPPSPPDDVLLSVTMFMSGLLGLTGVTARCAALLSPHRDTTVTILSAVPALRSSGVSISSSADIDTLANRDVTSDDVHEIWDRHSVCLRTEDDTDNKTDKVEDTHGDTESALYCGVCAYVLIDKTLAENRSVYDLIDKCTSLSLQAAHTKLKSWKNTKMSTRALLWKNCCMIPYVMHVLTRYITLLHTWGSVHLTLSYLDRLGQLAKFTASEYWMTTHAHLSAVVKTTLRKVIKVPAPRSGIGKVTCASNEFLSEYVELDRYLTAENQLVVGAVERSNSQEGNDGRGEEGEEREVAYPVFSSSLPPLHITKLTLLTLELSWCHALPSPEVIAEYYHLLKTARQHSRDMPHEVDKLCAAWLSLLADCQPHLSVKKNKAAPRRGRSRRNSGTKSSLQPVNTRSRRAAAGGESANKKGRGGGRSVKSRKQSGTDQKKRTSYEDYIGAGLAACSGLEPVFIKRELLKRKIKRAPQWEDIEEYCNVPFNHQLLKFGVSTDQELPSSWTVVSITKIDNTLYIGQRRREGKVLFSRELPYSVKSQVVGGDNTCCIDEMRHIIARNDDSVMHVRDKVQFWESRFQLDSILESLCGKLESEWLGPWRGLLLGRPTSHTYIKTMAQGARTLRERVMKEYDVEVGEFLSEYILDCYSFLSEEHLSELLPEIPLDEMLETLHELAPPAPPNTRHPSLLILGPETDILPWEACRVFKNQPISRIPSLNFALVLLALKKLPVELTPRETYYILNPSQNLPSTQACFETWLEEQEGWRGVAAKAPSIPEYQDGLKSDMFLYLGHGSGKEFLGGKPIQELESRAVALLMGCSSGKIKQTAVGGTGTPVEYLLSGCPAVLGYLWNITDRDCDRYSKKLLELWLTQGGSTSLLSLMNPSRDACKLPFLVGAAPVLYGLPDILAKSET